MVGSVVAALTFGLAAAGFAAPGDGSSSSERVPRPHIFLVLFDDFGWGNLGAHRTANSTAAERQARAEAYTPVIDGLIQQGIHLDRHYAYKFCSPSRSALQSGRLPVHVNTLNLAPSVHNTSDPVSGFAGIPRNMTGVAEKLRAAGYDTAFVGKWDAGCAAVEQTPYGRGYDSSFGYYQHANDYWNKGTVLTSTGEIDSCLNRVRDLSEHNATFRGPVLDRAELSSACRNSTADHPGCYEPELFRNRSLSVINQHNASRPLFLFHAFHLVHTPLEVPEAYLKRADERAKPGFFDDEDRRHLSAMAEYMDGVLGDLVGAFKARGLWENTLLVAITDNGGAVYTPGSGNNHPLRGGKFSDWEGGVRTNAFLAGGFIPKPLVGSSYDGVISIADWYGMFCDLAGVDMKDDKSEAANPWLAERGLPTLPPVDSVSGLWASITRSGEAAANLRPVLHVSEDAVLRYPYKLVVGNQTYSKHTGVLYPNCSAGATKPPFSDFKFLGENIPFLKNETKLEELLWTQDCGAGCLHDVSKDPNEHVDLAGDPAYADVLDEMQKLLVELNKDVFRPFRGENDAEACVLGMEMGGAYGPFVDAGGYYTGPFPNRTVAQREEEEAYKLLIRDVNEPEAREKAIEDATWAFLNLDIGIAVNEAMDRCRTNTTRGSLRPSSFPRMRL